MSTIAGPVAGLLSGYQPSGEVEAADLGRVQALLRSGADPWLRASPLHLTASALIVDPGSGRVLLRWHERQQAWLQVGGHGDPGETEPVQIALREAVEETGLPDLRPWPDDRLVQLAVVPVAAGKGEPPHEHADLRFLLATGSPDAATPEHETAPLRWLTLAEAYRLTTQDNLRATLDRAAALLGG